MGGVGAERAGPERGSLVPIPSLDFWHLPPGRRDVVNQRLEFKVRVEGYGHFRVKPRGVREKEKGWITSCSDSILYTLRGLDYLLF